MSSRLEMVAQWLIREAVEGIEFLTVVESLAETGEENEQDALAVDRLVRTAVVTVRWE